MAEVHIDTDKYNEVAELIVKDLPGLYEPWYPIEYIVKSTNSLIHQGIIQAEVIYYESRDVTHFIAGTGRLYDLKTPMEYEHKVFIYDPLKAEWKNVFYGTEKECIGYVIAEQCKLYGFNYTDYLRGKGKLVIFEKKLWEIGKDFTPQQNKAVQDLIELTMRNVRLKLGLGEDDDLPQLTLDEAIEGLR